MVSPDGERRSSFRVPSVEQRVGRLRIAQQEILVEIVNESADGFAILLGGTLDCHIGQSAHLQSTAGWAEVRIMNASVAQIAADVPASADVACTRLGLRRLRDLPVKRKTYWLAALLQMTRRPLTPLYSTWNGALLTLFMVACGGVLMVCGLEYPRGVITLVRRDMPHALSHPLPPPDSASSWASWLELPWAIRMPTLDSLAGEGQAADLMRMTRPSFLLHPTTTATLELSPDQLDRLQSIARGGSAESGQPSWDFASAQAAFKVLTPKQRATLQLLAR